MDHPAQWELSVASGMDQPGRMAFADRRYTRMDISWRSLKYVPNLDLMTEKYRQRKEGREKETALAPLENIAADWRGVVRKAEAGTFIHALRFFREQRLMVEVTIVWPEHRQQAVERTILDSIVPEEPGKPLRHWRALGMDVIAPSELELVSSDLKVGRIAWTFAARTPRLKKRAPQLVVERLAMVEHWLNEPLVDWLVKALPEKSRVLEKNTITFNSHDAQRLISERRTGTLARLRGLRRRRLDVAWTCPTDGRVYHLACTQAVRDKAPELPAGLAVDCCVPVPDMSAMAEL